MRFGSCEYSCLCTSYFLPHEKHFPTKMSVVLVPRSVLSPRSTRVQFEFGLFGE
ncbi:hypothetical protein C8R41DRAFT_858991 [Lentinula lateritia]|uniref:Uncharacterized protein n=1 Tax=Lentinula lateritia TaxID=40482 RepID=A0ABQ8V173_9AGAR|nr:hypothetical protein C8R41DRAFT_858991 [Lentinula lateritia]